MSLHQDNLRPADDVIGTFTEAFDDAILIGFNHSFGTIDDVIGVVTKLLSNFQKLFPLVTDVFAK
jgi:hypothetical protein